MSDSVFKTYSMGQDGYDYEKVKHQWPLYVNTLLCASGLLAFVLLQDKDTLRYTFMAIFLCKGIIDILFKRLNRRHIFAKKYTDNHFDFSGLIDLWAFFTLTVSLFVPIPEKLSVVTIWLIAQSAWACFISVHDGLDRLVGFLHGISVFTLAFSLVFFIWVDSYVFTTIGLLLYFIIRLTIAFTYREKTSRFVKKYKTVKFAGE